jgi:kynureninase
MDVTDRAHAEALDAADPLAPLRARFVDHDPDLVYVDGNSLGRLSLDVQERLEALTAQWGRELVRGWHEWIELPQRVGDALALSILGARPGEVLACDSTTVNLYKLAWAALDVRDGAILSDAHNFPTDRYVLAGLAEARERELRLLECDPVDGPTAAEVVDACAAGDVGLVSLSHVGYRSGALADMAAITQAAHDAGALVLWDLSHSAGAVPVALEASGADLAVGCTYKYLNGGPGSPAYLYVREPLQGRLRSPIWGWFGQNEQFQMERPYDPAPGVTGFLAGTPPIVALAAAQAGIDVVAEAGMDACRTKSIALTELAIALHDEVLAPLGFRLGTPRDAARRGSHVSICHDDAWPICRALIERANVVPDFRGPDAIRLGLPPLYTRFVDVWEAVDRIRRVVETGEHRLVDAARARVT